ncbi:MAG: VanW family protein, partial [Oscillospiraceae bacterium]|nr:VanW family protein [Oscillospiraceae bacterium]
MKRKLFCEISPLTYKISVEKNILQRRLRDMLARERFAQVRSSRLLPMVIYSHKSLIRRKLGSVDMRLQENKAVNLSLAAPRVTGILIKPGETFSFWRLVGRDSRRKGYLDGLTISNGKVSEGTGGGMCQFSNLIHWLVLHSELTITEHHHHDGFDLFPDFGRQIPFGTGTSIMYNYLDYRFRNETDRVYQFIVHTDGEYLFGELRADKPQSVSFQIKSLGERFVRENGTV